MAKFSDPSLLGSFYTVGPYYYYDRRWYGRRIRISTNQTTLEAAVKWVRDTPFGTKVAREKVEFKRSTINRIIDKCKHNAKNRGIPCHITSEDFIFLYDRAGGHCEVSGLPFDMRQIDGVARRPYAPSIDRINGELGYTRDNCRIVCAAVNLAMNDFGEEVLWNIATSMVFLRDKKPMLVNSKPQSLAAIYAK